MSNSAGSYTELKESNPSVSLTRGGGGTDKREKGKSKKQNAREKLHEFVESKMNRIPKHGGKIRL